MVEVTQETMEIYEEAARMYREGNRDGAVEYVRERLGDDAATEASEAMVAADKMKEEEANGKAQDAQEPNEAEPTQTEGADNAEAEQTTEDVTA